MKRWLIRLGLLVLLFYVGMMGLILAFENSLLFHPVTAAQDWESPAGHGLKVEDVSLDLPGGGSVHGWWCPLADVEPSAGAILFLHGNAGNLSHRVGSILDWQKELRLPVLIVDYPGYGKSPGTPSEQGCYATATAGYRWLTDTQNVPGERILLYGGSLGGAVAIELALHHPHRAIVVTRTFTSIPDMASEVSMILWPFRWLVTNRFDNMQKIGKLPKPIFIAHGDVDTVVPFAHGKRLYEAAPEPKRFHLLPRSDHNEPLASPFYTELREFLAKAESPTVAETPPRP